MKSSLCKMNTLVRKALIAARNFQQAERGALTIEWGQIIAIIVVVLLAVGALLQAFIPGFFQGILDKLGR